MSVPQSSLKGYESSLPKLVSMGTEIHSKDKSEMHAWIQRMYEEGEGLKGKRIIVTGTTTGLGNGLAAHLLALGAELVLPCRRFPPNFTQNLVDFAEKVARTYGKNPKFELEEGAQKRVVVVEMDLADLDSIKKCVETIEKEVGSSDYLVNNAGLVNATGMVSKQGHEVSLAVNAIGSALFTDLLLKKKLLGRKENDEKIIVVSVSSEEHRSSRMLNLEKPILEQEDPKDTSSGMSKGPGRYAFSKLVQSTFFLGLKDKFPDLNLHVFDICPGAVASQISEKSGGILGYVGKVVTWLFRTGLVPGFLSIEEASLPILRFLVDDEMLNSSEKHFLRSQQFDSREDTLMKERQDWVYDQIQQFQ